MPVSISTAIEKYCEVELYVADISKSNETTDTNKKIGVFVGPEGGWTDKETELFNSVGASNLSLGVFTLRAETACVVSASKIV